MTDTPDETQTITGRRSTDEVRRFTKVYRVGIDATPDTLNLDDRVEAFAQELVQRGLRPVSEFTLDDLSEPVGHHTAARHADGRHADRRPPTGYRYATLGVEAVPARAYDLGAAADAHTAAERAARVEGVTRGYDADLGPSDTPTYDQTAHEHLESLIADSSETEQD